MSNDAGIQVLLIEDNPGDAFLITEMLSSSLTGERFEVHHTDNIQTAKELMNTHNIQVILLDLSLPDSYGLESFEKIYNREIEVPILVLTGLDDENTALQTLQAGAQDYLVKGSIQSDSLERAIRYAIERQRLTEALEASEKHLRRIIDNNADGIIITDHSGNILFVNQAAEKLFSQPEAKILGQNFPALAGETDPSSSGEILWPAKNKEQTITTEMRVVEIEWQKQPAYLASLRDISNRKRYEDTINRNAKRLELIQNIDRAILAANSPQSVAEEALNNVRELIPSDYAGLLLLDIEHERITEYASLENGNQILNVDYHDLLDFQEIPKTTWNGEIHLVQDLIQTKRVYLFDEIFFQRGMLSCLGVPLLENNTLIGILRLGSKKANAFLPEHLEIAQDIANSLMVGVQKTSLYKKAQQQAEEAETLRRAGAAVVASLQLDETVERILEQLSLVLPYSSASVLMLKEDNTLEVIGGRGWDDLQALLGRRFPLSKEYPHTHVITEKKPFIVEDIEKHSSFFNQDLYKEILSWLGVPLIYQDRVIGMLALNSYQPRDFIESQKRLVTAFADQVAIAIENAHLYEIMQKLAITDSLTGLYNRRHFFTLSTTELERSRRYKLPLAVIMFDIDRFKLINDTYGHAAGDVTLKSIAESCRKVLRQIDIIGRYGGEEFVILLPETDLDRAQQAAERLRQQISGLIVETARGKISVTISLGVSELPPSEQINNIEILLDQADQALYKAKQNGRNQVAVYR